MKLNINKELFLSIKNIFCNKIYKIDKTGRKKRVFWVKGLNVNFTGKNAIVILHRPIARFQNCQITCGNNCKIEIGGSRHILNKLNIFAMAKNVECKIGKSFSCTNGCEILLHKEPNLSVIIGDDCMFGSNIMLRTSDVHTIYDLNTQKVLNYGKSIKIGNHCWLAMNVTVLKGVTIANNCVIGSRSTVTRNCEVENSIYVGAPAKLKKTNIGWDRQIPCNFK